MPFENTLRIYGKDWAQYGRWCRMRGTEPLPPSPELVEFYIADLGAPRGTAQSKVQSPTRPLSVASIERRLSDLAWADAQPGLASSAEMARRYQRRRDRFRVNLTKAAGSCSRTCRRNSAASISVIPKG